MTQVTKRILEEIEALFDEEHSELVAELARAGGPGAHDGPEDSDLTAAADRLFLEVDRREQSSCQSHVGARAGSLTSAWLRRCVRPLSSASPPTSAIAHWSPWFRTRQAPASHDLRPPLWSRFCGRVSSTLRTSSRFRMPSWFVYLKRSGRLQPFVGANERRDRDRRLHFVRGERVVVQRLHGLRIKMLPIVASGRPEACGSEESREAPDLLSSCYRDSWKLEAES